MQNKFFGDIKGTFGFGCMRFPMIDKKVDVEHTKQMIDRFIKEGFNYFDTAHTYIDGQSEPVLKECLVERYPREAYILTNKLTTYCFEKEEEIEPLFEKQLAACGVTYFDFYLMHAVDDENFANYEKYDCFNFGFEKKRQGLIRHLGFSFHGTPDMLVKILDKYPDVEFVQIQLNYLDWDSEKVCSGKLYEILSERNIPIVVMEPIKGGSLAQLRNDLEEKFKAVNPDKSIASWALRYVGSLPGVMTLLSGMSLLEQMEDNVKTFTGFTPLSDKEKETIKEVVTIMKETPQIGCTGCSYCTDGCPMNVGIPDIFNCRSKGFIFCLL